MHVFADVPPRTDARECTLAGERRRVFACVLRAPCSKQLLSGGSFVSASLLVPLLISS